MKKTASAKKPAVQHAALFEEAKKVLVGGVNSPVRSFRSVGGDPVFVKRARGSRIFAEDGRELIDYCMSWGALLLGLIFALAFCPVSAALFFGSLIPLAVSSKSPLLFPFVYGLGTGLPVIVFAVAIVFGVHWVSALFKKITAAERFVRIATGAVLILIGLYYIAKYIFYFELF